MFGFTHDGVREVLRQNLFDAMADYREALQIAQALDDREGTVLYTGNLADIALARSDWSGAETLAREVLRLAEQLGRRELIAWISMNLATALLQQDRKAAAVPYAQRAVDIFTELGSPDIASARKTLDDCER